MFHSILYFTLGFLSAAFVALAAAPAIWRRAVTLTRRRVEASLPMTANEIQADKDRLRADYAMTIRRLEMGAKAVREKAAVQAAEIGRNRDEIKSLSAELDAAQGRIGELEDDGEVLRGEVARRAEELRLLTDRLAETDRQLQERSRDLDDLGRLHRETSISASNLQIDLVAKETEVEKLSGDLSLMREEKREQAAHMREMARELRAAREAQKAEAQRAADLDKRLQKAIARLAEREEKLDQRERELQRMRDDMKKTSEAGMFAASAATAIARTPDEPAGEGSNWSGGQDNDRIIARLTDERSRLEERLTRMARENRRLREASNGAGQGGGGAAQENAALRDRITMLAAEVVNLTMRLEGEESPARKALNGALNGHGDSERDPEAPISIADRIKALQHRSGAVQ